MTPNTNTGNPAKETTMTETTTEQAEHEAAEAEAQDEAALAEQHAEGPRLKWKGEIDEWWAENTAGVMFTDPDDPQSDPIVASFFVDKLDSIYKVDQTIADLLDDPTPDAFPTLEAAQRWCETRNLALCAAAKPAADIVTPPIGSAPRVELPESVMLLQLADIVVQEQEVARLEETWEAAKDAFDAGVDKLRRLIRNRPGPGPFKKEFGDGVTVTEDKTGNLEVNLPADAFDDDRLASGTERVIIEHNEGGACRVAVAQRVGGRWAFRAHARIGIRIREGLSFEGHYANAEEAAAAALAEVKAWVGKCAQHGFRGGQAAEADGIERAIDAVSKAAVAEGVGA